MPGLSPLSEKRAFERVSALIDIHCLRIDCYGTITNLSANGIFIRSQKISFPFESQFEICIPLQESKIKVRVRVNRMTRSTGYYDGVAVELVNPSEKYLEFITRLKADDKIHVSFHNS